MFNKAPLLGCIENALDTTDIVKLKKFEASCRDTLGEKSKLIGCVPIYRYDYAIPMASTSQSLPARIEIELADSKIKYSNIYQTPHRDSDIVYEKDQTVIVQALAKVDDHLDKLCGIGSKTTLSITDDRTKN